MKNQIAIIGLGYVGLPLAIASGKKYKTIGYDINPERIEELNKHFDSTLEIEKKEFEESTHLQFTYDEMALKNCNIFVITVPTPITSSKRPDLSIIKEATHLAGKLLKKNDIVIYESTVFPGCTEEICVPILEKTSSLIFNQDFFCGYSPERINPGDKEHNIYNIKKITSGSTPQACKKVDAFYDSILHAGTHPTSSIKVAEAAKVIENSQRDINIAFVNELSIIFHKLNIDTLEVLEAANTKWNFLPFYPGLVGGHCISVDPFYLTHKAEEMGYYPQVITAGRRINDTIGQFIAQRVLKLLAQKNKLSQKKKIGILGITFKENCPDVRNSRVIDIYDELTSYHFEVEVMDPIASKDNVWKEYKIELQDFTNWSEYDALILAVAHENFKNLHWSKIREKTAVIFDVKGILPKKFVDDTL